ncbi:MULTISPECIES: plasmid pRiA4b ORF-3 family protein [Thermoanaerobacterium]|uniref:plasmid pRiA4b ORF-3 family protein n=1 Tax=Thermoanaerobacterium TaxID=28895 RepID=UPI00123913F4|nr:MULTISPECIES: plasmid pRiA4b ORF-3 family protein [Thermoanaerobacterium]KAA5806398.1 plasmid pRiA4b ORF-3 family protein [Thermoanaerobacterium thermosaccharolyticum]MDE4541352.1 plasmid pRiA4b ORF-3 family protein [Thermoanaerobacterium sp. R66]
MLIQCTKKLLDVLERKPVTHEEENLLFSWHANLITLNRRKTIVLVNDKNRYVVVLYGLKAKDFKRLDEVILNAIRLVLLDECIDEEIVEEYIRQAGKVVYGKTKNSIYVGKMNAACNVVYLYEDLLLDNTVYQTFVSKVASRYWVGKQEEGYTSPSKEMFKDLEDFVGRPIFKCRAVELKVTLEIENHNIWRRLVVPINTTFTQLHKVLQAAFGWQDYHLHEFFIYGNERQDVSFINYPSYSKDGYKAIVNLVSDEEAFDYPNESDIEMIFEKGIKLSKYIPQYKRLMYVYDFGDNWQHYIEVQKIIDNYDKNYAVCIDGEGNAPPEDVGGEYGYDEFLEIISDKNNPEYENMMAWGENQGYKEFDIEEVNKKISLFYN